MNSNIFHLANKFPGKCCVRLNLSSKNASRKIFAKHHLPYGDSV